MYISPDQHRQYLDARAARKAKPFSRSNVHSAIDAQLRKIAATEPMTDKHRLQVMQARRDERQRAGYSAQVYVDAIARLESKIAQEADKQAWLKSVEYETTMQVVESTVELVSRFDQDSSDTVAAAVGVWHQTRDTEQLFSDLSKASTRAALNESSQRRAADQESAKAARDLANADLARVTRDAENAKLLEAAQKRGTPDATT